VSWWHQVKVRLGLEDEWDDEYYEDEYLDDDPGSSGDEYDEVPARSYAAGSPYGSGANPNSVRRVDRGPDLDRARSHGGGSLRSVPTGGASVTTVSPQVKMHIVEPKSFAEVQSIADKFKEGSPVLLNLSNTKADLAKRFIDFASGLTYGLEGGLQKVSDKVFMLTPHNVDVTDADRRRLRDTGLFPRE
jgi:cell division inhibitor SepF